MIYNPYDKKIRFIINLAYLLSVMILVYIAFRYAFRLFFPFLASTIIALTAEPFVNIFVNRFKFKRSIASIVCIIVIYVVTFVMLFFISSVAFISLKNLTSSLPLYFEKFSESELIGKIIGYIKNADLSKLITGSIGSNIISPVSGMIKTLPSILFSIIIILVSALLISSSLPIIKKFINLQISPKNAGTLVKIKNTVFMLLKQYVKSYGIIMSITFIELLVLFLIFNIKPAVILSFFIAVIDILPVLGIGIVLIPWSVLCVISGDIIKASVLISIYLLVTVIRQIIEPRIIGKSIGLHPFVTLIAFFIGFKLFGIIGMLVFPTTITIIAELNKQNIIHLWNDISIDNGKS